jgi:hypothetical protein
MVEAGARVGDDDRARIGECLQPGGEVRRLADHRLFLRRALADQIADHHQPGGDADTRLKIDGPHIEASDGIDDTQPSQDRALGVLLMGSRVTEINQHPVAYILGHKPVQLPTTPATAR